MPAPDLLTADQERLRGDIRTALGQLGDLIAALGASTDERAILADAVRGLDELFLLVVVGEFNAGKSALLNELIGSPALAEGVTPTTAAVTIVRYGERDGEERRADGLVHRRVPVDLLRDLAVVDTPGTNAIVRQHEQLTRDFIPRADLVLFVTSADRPFSESERAFMEAIVEWGRKIVVAINKIDLMQTPAEVDQVIGFVRDGLRSSLGLVPPVFPVSVRLARLAGENADQAAARALLAASRTDELRRYVFETLDEAERLRLKLLAPLGAADRLATNFEQIIAERQRLLADDLRLVENVEEQISLHAEDMRRALAPRLSEVANVIHELNDRGERFFDETVRIGRILDLLNPERTRGAFEREVVKDTAAQVDSIVAATVDWFVDAEAKLWRQIAATIRQRQQVSVGGAEDVDFLAARREMLHGAAERTQRALREFDRDAQSREVGESMRDAVAQTALAEIGAVSLGAAIALIFGTLAADITGLRAATFAAGLGLYILPARKRKALAEFHRRTTELRESLVRTLTTQMEREITGSTERVREAIAPFTREVRAEHKRLDGQRTAIVELRERLGRLRSSVGESASETAPTPPRPQAGAE